MPVASGASRHHWKPIMPVLGVWGIALDGAPGPLWAVGMRTEFVTLQERKRSNLARIARYDSYLVTEHPDGTLVWEPASVITETEKRLLQNADLLAEIAANRQDPSRLRTRDRSRSPRPS